VPGSFRGGCVRACRHPGGWPAARRRVPRRVSIANAVLRVSTAGVDRAFGDERRTERRRLDLSPPPPHCWISSHAARQAISNARFARHTAGLGQRSERFIRARGGLLEV